MATKWRNGVILFLGNSLKCQILGYECPHNEKKNSKDMGLRKPNTPYIAYESKKYNFLICTYIDLTVLEMHT